LAFNLADRGNMLSETKEEAPQIYRGAAYTYGAELVLFAGDSVIGNSNGAQQGDPLGSTLYGLGTLKLIKRILMACPGIKLSPHYLDDGIFAGEVEDLVKVIEIIREEGPSIGAFLNLKKSMVWWPSQVRPDWSAFPLELQRNEEQGFKILGAAVGSAEFKRDLLDKKIAKQEITLDKISSIRRAHHQYTLIKYCANSYKYSHFFRTVDPALYPAQLKIIDEQLSVALADTFGCEITPTDRLLIALPVKKGGLGIPTACRVLGF
jgi:hypothetical protein